MSGMLRTSVMVGMVLLSRLALADADATFRDFVTRSAQEGSQYIESWYATNLDSDAALEHVAVLCPLEKGGSKGSFLIEKDAAHRWEITFDFDSRTKVCKGKPADQPKLEQRKSNMVELYQGHLQGYEIIYYALRVGQPVIVREDEVEKDGGKVVVKNWDDLVKKKKAKAYQSPESLRQITN
jgi:hypothetical protein